MLKRVQTEIRGLSFLSEITDEDTAKMLASHLRGIGAKSKVVEEGTKHEEEKWKKE